MRMDSSRVLARRLSALFLGAFSLVAALAIIVVFHRFFPTGRLETPPPGSAKFRAFTLNEGFGDMSINLYVSDWPHTFLAPARIGDLYWPENYTAGAFWTNDGSVVAMRTRWNTGPDSYFTGAYDFREHRHLHSAYLRKDGGEIHQEIASLVEARGGLGPFVREEDGKGGEHPHTPLPLWTWIPPIVVAALGWWGATRLWRCNALDSRRRRFR